MQAQVSLAQSLRSLFQSAANSNRRGEDVDGHMENAWLQAVYNAVVFALVGVVASVALGVYFILEPFLYPILWAILLGTFLFPFKKSCTTRFTLWLYGLESSAVPLCVGLAVSPFAFVGYLSSCLDDLIVTYWKQFVFVICGMAGFYVFVQFNIFPILFLVVSMLGEVFEALDKGLSLIGPLLLITVLGAFVLSVVIFRLNGPHSLLLAPLLIVVWFLVICSLAKWLFGAVGLSIATGLFSTACLAYFIRSKARRKRSISSSDSEPDSRKQSIIMDVITDSLDKLGMAEQLSASDCLSSTKSVRFQDECTDFPVSIPSTDGIEEKSSDEDEGDDLSTQGRKNLSQRKNRANPLKFEKREHRASNQVFLLLVTCCLMVALWSRPWLLLLVSPLLIWRLACKALSHFYLHDPWQSLRRALAAQFLPYAKVLWPEPLPTFVELCLALDRYVLQFFRLSVGGIMSAGIIVGLLVGSLALVALLVFEIQVEVSYTFGMATQVLDTSVNNSWIVRLSGGAINSSSDIHNTMEQIANSSFHYGRDWLTTQVQQILGDAGKDSAVVDRVIELYDNFYHSYVLKNATSVFGPEQQLSDRTNVNVWNMAVKFTEILNLNAVISLLKSLWSVISLNLSMALSVLTFFSVLVFSGGTLLLNFAVFITVLFYLLCYSQEEYLPIQWVISALPEFVTNSSENNYPETFSRVIRSVFHATLRRVGFYSLYTWMVLSVLGIPMTILPSVLAGIAGAVPFVGPYWMGLPAILQLWLVEERVAAALLALVLFLVPPFLIDSIINSEIEGSHPYLTGLAIVGGVYYAGLGGALYGPILLCCLLFVVQVIADYL